MRIQNPRGQTVLITVLVLTIALTVALSLIRRSTTDVQMTGQLEESARAFSAAEAGIEDVLKRAVETTMTIQSANGPATVETTYTAIAGSDAAYTYPTSTDMGDAATIWLVPHDDDGSLAEEVSNDYCNGGACTIDVCWEPQTPKKPAIEVMVLYKTGSTYDVERFTFDPAAARIGNHFTRNTTLGKYCGITANDVYKETVTLPTTSGYRPLLLRIRPYYNKTTVTVDPPAGRTLPAQGFEVSSVGKTESGITRKIVVKKQYDAPASVFDFVLYSNTGITNEEEYNITL